MCASRHVCLTKHVLVPHRVVGGVLMCVNLWDHLGVADCNTVIVKVDPNPNKVFTVLVSVRTIAPLDPVRFVVWCGGASGSGSCRAWDHTVERHDRLTRHTVRH